MVRVKDESGTVADELRAFGLRYPGAHTKSPWPGHLDLAVKDKTFAYLSLAGEPLKVSCKLPHSAEAALSLPFTEPTPYGLGKSGWVTANFPDDAPVPVELLREWIDESYRAQAPKRMSAGVPPLGGATETLEASAAPSVAAGRSTVKQGGAKAKAPPRATPKRAGATIVAKKRPAAKAASRVVAKPKGGSRVAKAAAAPVGRAQPAPARRPTAKRASASGAVARSRPPARAKKRGSGGKRAAP
jgi:predicted DNA-binding protein (MmcQ/YjbR family)